MLGVESSLQGGNILQLFVPADRGVTPGGGGGGDVASMCATHSTISY